MNKEAGKFARIVIPTPLKEPLIYKVPDSLWNQIETGMRVLIPLGKRKVTGVVLELLRETVVPETRAILALLDERRILDTALLQLTQWVAQYYLTTLGEVFSTLLPPSLRRETRRTIASQTRNVFRFRRLRRTHSRPATSKQRKDQRQKTDARNARWQSVCRHRAAGINRCR